MADFYVTLAPIFIATLGSLLIVLVLKYSLPVHNLVASLALNLTVTIATTLGILVLFTRGRQALSDVIYSTTFLFRKRIAFRDL